MKDSRKITNSSGTLRFLAGSGDIRKDINDGIVAVGGDDLVCFIKDELRWGDLGRQNNTPGAYGGG